MQRRPHWNSYYYSSVSSSKDNEERVFFSLLVLYLFFFLAHVLIHMGHSIHWTSHICERFFHLFVIMVWSVSFLLMIVPIPLLCAFAESILAVAILDLYNYYKVFTIGYLNGDNIIFKEDIVKIGTCPKVREIKIIFKEETKKTLI